MLRASQRHRRQRTRRRVSLAPSLRRPHHQRHLLLRFPSPRETLRLIHRALAIFLGGAGRSLPFSPHKISRKMSKSPPLYASRKRPRPPPLRRAALSPSRQTLWRPTLARGKTRRMHHLAITTLRIVLARKR